MRLIVSRPSSPETGHRGITVYQSKQLLEADPAGVDIDDVLDTCGDATPGLCGEPTDVLIVYAGDLMSWQTLYIAPRCSRHAETARKRLREDRAQFVEVDA